MSHKKQAHQKQIKADSLKDRKACYENVSLKNLGENCPEHICTAPDAKDG